MPLKVVNYISDSTSTILINFEDISIATIHLAIEPVDMRKSINGLSLIVQTCFDLDATSNALYIFTNKPKNKLKIIYWDRDGFWLFMKRLNKGAFKWPKDDDNNTRIIDERQFSWLVEYIQSQKG